MCERCRNVLLFSDSVSYYNNKFFIARSSAYQIQKSHMLFVGPVHLYCQGRFVGQPYILTEPKGVN